MLDRPQAHIVDCVPPNPFHWADQGGRPSISDVFGFAAGMVLCSVGFRLSSYTVPLYLARVGQLPAKVYSTIERQIILSSSACVLYGLLRARTL